MWKLFEGFKILCTDFDHILEKRGETIQGRILIIIREIRYPIDHFIHSKIVMKSFLIRFISRDRPFLRFTYVNNDFFLTVSVYY